MPQDPKTPLTLTLTLEETNLVLAHLNRGVFQEVNSLIGNIINQANTQLAPPSPGQPEPTKVEG